MLKKQNTKVVFAWASGSQVKANAQDVGEEICRIMEERGESTPVSPSILVEYAKDPKSPLHTCLEWNNRRAAEQHRIEQMKYVTRSLKKRTIYVLLKKTPRKLLRAFVSVVSPSGDRGYVKTAYALSDKDYKIQVLNDALAGLLAWQDRFDEFTELSRIRKVVSGECVKIERMISRKAKKSSKKPKKKRAKK